MSKIFIEIQKQFPPVPLSATESLILQQYEKSVEESMKRNDIKGVISKSDIAGTENANALLQFIYDYQPLEFTKTDFQKRKRVNMNLKL